MSKYAKQITEILHHVSETNQMLARLEERQKAMQEDITEFKGQTKDDLGEIKEHLKMQNGLVLAHAKAIERLQERQGILGVIGAAISIVSATIAGYLGIKH